MSLFMPYEKIWDMPLGGDSDEKQAPRWLGNIIYGFLAFVFKVCFRYRVDGRENLRGFEGKSGVLIVSNHTSFLDVAFMYLSARPNQWIRFLGREDLYTKLHGFIGQILSRVGSFPVKRDFADRSAIKRAVHMLKTKQCVGILPEGTRRNKGSKSPELHSGAALIARMGHAPILPMTVRNAEKIKEKGKFFRFPKVTIEYGDPLLVSDFEFLPKDERLDGCTWYAMRACFALSQQCAFEDVAMTELFPESKDYTAVFASHEIPVHTTGELVSQMGRMKHSQTEKAVEA